MVFQDYKKTNPKAEKRKLPRRGTAGLSADQWDAEDQKVNTNSLKMLLKY